jgi:hypothetical protein
VYFFVLLDLNLSSISGLHIVLPHIKYFFVCFSILIPRKELPVTLVMFIDI